MNELRIAKDLSFPINGVTQTFAAIARKGAGKTYFATKLAELMLSAGAQVIALDPVGNWFGLRLDADGKAAGLPVYVFGGEHGDITLTAESGRNLAALVVDKRISAVLDVSAFRKGERERFCAEFAEEFFHRKKNQRSPVHLFIEEAQKFIPQQCGPEERRMLGAFEDIVRLGRNYGIGATLVTQRPQSVNKEVLSQVECLVTLQINGLHERKAIEGWVSEHGLDRGLIGELPSLEIGEAFVWSPGWLRTFKRVRIEKKATFDASATPTVGHKLIEPGKLSPVDIESLQSAMAAEVERAKADNPVKLRKRIVALESELRRTPAVKIDPARESEIRKDASRSVHGQYAPILERIRGAAAVIDGALQGAGEFSRFIEAITEPKREPPKLPPAPPPPPVKRLAPTGRAASTLTGPEQRILNAIAWLESIGNAQPEQAAVAFLAGYTIGGGAFNNPRGALRGKGLVEYFGGERIGLTDPGRDAAQFPDQVLTTAELQRCVLERLPGPERRILEVLIRAYPKSIDNERCARESGYEPGGGAFNNPRGRLRSLGLIEYPERGAVRARELLFLEVADAR